MNIFRSSVLSVQVPGSPKDKPLHAVMLANRSGKLYLMDRVENQAITDPAQYVELNKDKLSPSFEVTQTADGITIAPIGDTPYIALSDKIKGMMNTKLKKEGLSGLYPFLSDSNLKSVARAQLLATVHTTGISEEEATLKAESTVHSQLTSSALSVLKSLNLGKDLRALPMQHDDEDEDSEIDPATATLEATIKA